MGFLAKIGNFFRGANSSMGQVAGAMGNQAQNMVTQATTSSNFSGAVGGVSTQISNGIQAGHDIALLMQQLSLAAAQDSAAKKAGEQVKSAAQ